MATDATVGTIVSHYRLIEKLGGGGMGVVYEIEHTRLGRRVTLKSRKEYAPGNQQALEGRYAAKRISTSENEYKFQFGLPDQFIFRLIKGSTACVYRIKMDGSGQRPVSATLIKSIDSVSPNGDGL